MPKIGESNDSPLVLIGAGGFAKEVLASYGDIAAVTPSAAPVLGLVDDNRDLHGSIVCGYTVLGDIQWLVDYGIDRVRCVVAVGDPRTRARIVKRLDAFGAEYQNLTHPSAVVWSTLSAASDNVVQPYAWITADAEIGSHVHVNGFVCLAHNVRVGDFTTFAPYANVNGHCTIEEGAYVGSHAVLRQGVTVGAWATVGMCACVLDDVPSGVTVAGVPARIIPHSSPE